MPGRLTDTSNKEREEVEGLGVTELEKVAECGDGKESYEDDCEDKRGIVVVKLELRHDRGADYKIKRKRGATSDRDRGD